MELDKSKIAMKSIHTKLIKSRLEDILPRSVFVWSAMCMNGNLVMRVYVPTDVVKSMANLRAIIEKIEEVNIKGIKGI